MHSIDMQLRRFSELTGRIIAWLTLPMVFGTFVIVVLRYVFDLGWIWMQESIMWLHAAVFMLASAYTLNRNEHVRVDVFYRGMSPRKRAWVDALGTGFFLLPVAGFIFASSWEYVVVSWDIQEASREAGGLPYPFVSLLKSMILLSAFTLILQGVADLIRNVLILMGRTAHESSAASNTESG